MSLHQQVDDLRRQMAEDDAKRLELKQALADAERQESLEDQRHYFRRYQQLIRRPKQDYGLWPTGLILVGAVFVGAIAFILIDAVAGSYAISFTAFMLSGGVAAAALAWSLFVPLDERLNRMAEELEVNLRSLRGKKDRLRAELASAEHALRVDIQSLDAIEKSLQFQREELLRENWKAMRGPEWEDFLVRVFRLLGATVEPTGTSGDQGVDLIAVMGPRCYAIQAKGYVSAVGNGAVQEAVAGMAHYRCNACAVITNSRFTTGAIALAESNRCRLIGEDEVPSLVMGNLVL
jgi:hypothetical protein